MLLDTPVRVPDREWIDLGGRIGRPALKSSRKSGLIIVEVQLMLPLANLSALEAKGPSKAPRLFRL
jgi:hypothetical protein